LAALSNPVPIILCPGGNINGKKEAREKNLALFVISPKITYNRRKHLAEGG
jgi:hypothetical protein